MLATKESKRPVGRPSTLVDFHKSINCRLTTGDTKNLEILQEKLGTKTNSETLRLLITLAAKNF